MMKFPSSFPIRSFNSSDYAILKRHIEIFAARNLIIWVDDALGEQGSVTIYLKPPVHLDAFAVAISIYKLQKKGILFNSVRWMVSYGFAVSNLQDVPDEQVISPLGTTAHTDPSEAIEQALHDIYNDRPNAISFEDGVIYALSM